MGDLFIIGNGFDLSHDLPTSYKYFYNYLCETSGGGAFINNIEKVVSCYSDQLWNDFEKSLGTITLDYVMEEAMMQRQEHNNEFDYGPLDESFITDFIIKEHLTSLHKLDSFVSKWVKTINVKDADAKTSYQNIFKGNASFITFNYTKTLEKIYGVEKKNIHHIHGNVDDPIMGHGMDNSDDIFNLAVEEDFILEEFKSNISSQLQQFHEASKKDIGLFLNQINSFIEKVEYEIKEIHIIGHSLGEVDQPYFQALMDDFSNEQWVITYFNEKDKCGKEVSLKKMNIKGNIKLVSVDEYLQRVI